MVALASASGWTVDATHLETTPAGTTDTTWHRCDITEPGEVVAVIATAQPTHIVNAAYKQSGPKVHAICADGAASIAEYAHDCEARFVHVSTDLVFDGKLGRPYREDDPTSPLGEYGEAKVSAERRVAEHCPDAVIARTSLIYGAPDAPQEQLVRRAHDDGDISFFTDEWRTAVHVEDLAMAVLALAHGDFSGVVHVAGQERLNRLQFAEVLAAALGLDPGRLTGRTQDPSLGPRAQDVSLDTTLAASIDLALAGPTERLSSGY